MLDGLFHHGCKTVFYPPQFFGISERQRRIPVSPRRYLLVELQGFCYQEHKLMGSCVYRGEVVEVEAKDQLANGL